MYIYQEVYRLVMNIPSIQMIKTLKISEETHARLLNHGKMGETFEDVIIKLLEHYEKTHKLQK